MSEPRHKELALRIKSAASGVPDEAQLAAIRMYTLADFPADQLVVREYYLAHNAIDRDGEVFDEGLLKDFASTLVGKGIHIRHPGGWDGDSGPGEGRIFGASTETMSIDAARKVLGQPDLVWPPDRSQAVLLKTAGYFVRTDENKSLLTKMDAGIAGDVSIGFNAASRAPITDGEGRTIQASRLMGPGEGLEMSLVWLGAQQGARAFKSAPRNSHEDAPMTPEEKAALDKATARITELEDAAKATAKKAEKDAADALAKASADYAAVKAALDGDANLLTTPKQLADLVTAGKSYRDGLIDDIVKGERLAKTIGDTEEAVTEAKSAYAEMPTAKLVILAKRFEGVTRSGGAGIQGGDPNASKGGPGPGAASAVAGSKAAGPMDSDLL